MDFKGDTRSLDYSSFGLDEDLLLRHYPTCCGPEGGLQVRATH